MSVQSTPAHKGLNFGDEKIFVTGATGFVGAYLVRHLVSLGYKNLICLRRSTSNMALLPPDLRVSGKAVEWVEGDILDTPFLESVFERGIAQVYHCAAVVSFDPRDRAAMYAINGTGTANIVNFCLDFDVSKLVHVSSVAAVGRHKDVRQVSEKNRWENSDLNTHYAISKFQAEQEVWRGIAEGLNAAIVNPSVILGAQFWEQGTGRLFTQVWKGLKFYTEGATGFVDVRDVVRFTVLLMESDISEQRFILSGENWTYKAIFEAIAEKLKKPKARIAISPFLRQIAWRVEWIKSKFTGKRPLITRETARTSSHVFEYMNDKSLKYFSEFSYTSISKTLDETAVSFLESQKTSAVAAIF
jgi:dihydroflavonol-4-reductase